jgi:hypothetical protein
VNYEEFRGCRGLCRHCQLSAAVAARVPDGGQTLPGKADHGVLYRVAAVVIHSDHDASQ